MIRFDGGTYMEAIMQVKREQLKEKLGEIVSLDYKGKDFVIAYLGGVAPVKIKTNLTQEEFDRLCGE
jgi:hypothetical protein